MFTSPSPFPAEARRTLAEALNARLADGLDLRAQIKVAHWNVKGPLFPSLHPLFESLAARLAHHNDALAERAVTLGARAYGTVRHVAAASTLTDYPQETTRGLEHVELLAERIDAYLHGLRAARSVAEQLRDVETADLVTGVIGEFEKHAWFLRATLEA